MNKFRFQSGISGRGLTLRRRSLYFLRAIAGIPVLISDFPAAKGVRRAKSNKSTQVMNDICNATNGRGLEFVNWIVNISKQRLTKDFDSSELCLLEMTSTLDCETIQRVVNELDSDGYSVIRQWVSRDAALHLGEELSKIRGTEYSGGRFDNFKSWLKNGLKPRLMLDQLSVRETVGAMNLDISGLTLVARRYLRSKPYLLGPDSWYTKSTANRTDLDLEESAMAFHCDSDFFGFFKIFLLCTDVEDVNGPFAFLRGSHKGKRHVQGRLTDEQLNIASGERVLATGTAGDIFFVATKGWHKATPPIIGHRLMVQWLFSTGYFGSATS